MGIEVIGRVGEEGEVGGMTVRRGQERTGTVGIAEVDMINVRL